VVVLKHQKQFKDFCIVNTKMYSPKNPYYSAMTVRSGIHKPIFRKGAKKDEEKDKKDTLPEIDISKMMKGFGDDSKGVSRNKNHIFFYDDVSTESCLSLNREIQAVVRELRNYSLDYSCESPKIYIHINSYGGELLACFSTLDYIKNCPVPVVSIIEGCAASAATLISVVASERYMTSSSWMLIHQLSGGYWGKYEEMEEDLDNSRKFMEKIYEIYEEHTKLKRSELKKILKRDEWWDYQTCLKNGLVDGVYNGWGGVSSGGSNGGGGGSTGSGVLTRSASKK
jgi:ATP-dependent protease ClpP protease subunit